jgi:UBX domain-containing protein 6
MCPLATAEQSLPLFAKILRNAVVGAIALHRQLRLGNPRVRKAIVDVEGGLALLTAAGFVVVPSAGGGEGEDGEDGALAVLTPDDDALARAHEALAQVERGLEVPAAPAAAVAAAPPPAPKPRPTPPQQPPPPIIPRRCASLILPVAPDSQPLPEAFFQRTAHEVRDEYKALVARRQRGELLLTRAAREAAARGGGGGPAAAASTTALVRIRLPDGCSLEGRFGAGEPYEAVREFVRAALREPRMAFELRGPTGADKQPATTKPTETVREAGLCPSAVLNFRPLLAGGGGAVALASSGVLLKDEVLSGGSWA